MNLNNLTIKSQEALQRAHQIGLEMKHQAIEVGHIMKGILEVDEDVTPFVFKKLGVKEVVFTIDALHAQKKLST